MSRNSVWTIDSSKSKEAWNVETAQQANTEREKKSFWKYVSIVNCHNLIFGVAASVLMTLFAIQVRNSLHLQQLAVPLVVKYILDDTMCH